MQWVGVPFELWGPPYPNRDIVGESNYVQNIRALWSEYGDGGTDEVIVSIFLLPEPENPYDSNAVVAVGGGRRLGYLPREEAARYAPVLARVVSSGFLPVTVGRVYFREYDYEGLRDEMGSVRVALDEPHRILPMNGAPVSPYTVLPAGNAIQVSGEEEHMDVLSPYLHPAGDCSLFVTLHAVTVEGPRSRKELVEVRVDGARVGQLSPKMSAELLPALEHLAGRGLTAAARARLQGNSLKAEVVLYAARAHELAEEWLANPTQPGASSAVTITLPDREEPQVVNRQQATTRRARRASSKPKKSGAAGYAWAVFAIIVIALLVAALG